MRRGVLVLLLVFLVFMSFTVEDVFAFVCEEEAGCDPLGGVLNYIQSRKEPTYTAGDHIEVACLRSKWAGASCKGERKDYQDWSRPTCKGKQKEFSLPNCPVGGSWSDIWNDGGSINWGKSNDANGNPYVWASYLSSDPEGSSANKGCYIPCYDRPDESKSACEYVSGRTWLGSTNKCCYGSGDTTKLSSEVSGEGCCYGGSPKNSGGIGLPNTDNRFLCYSGVWYAPTGQSDGPWDFSTEVAECTRKGNYYLKGGQWKTYSACNYCNDCGVCGTLCQTGTIQTQTCGVCGTQSRTCTLTCRWPTSYSTCNDPAVTDPYKNDCDSTNGCGTRTSNGAYNMCDLGTNTYCDNEFGKCSDSVNNDCDGDSSIDSSDTDCCSATKCNGCISKPLCDTYNTGQTDCYWDFTNSKCCPDGTKWSGTSCEVKQESSKTTCQIDYFKDPPYITNLDKCAFQNTNDNNKWYATCLIDDYGKTGFKEEEIIEVK